MEIYTYTLLFSITTHVLVASKIYFNQQKSKEKNNFNLRKFLRFALTSMVTKFFQYYG